MNNKPLTFDIETLPTTDKQVIERIASTIRPPGNIKKKKSHSHRLPITLTGKMD